MPKRIDRLTENQRAAMGPHAQAWIKRALDTGPVDWAAWEQAIADCYRYAGLEWHGNVVRAGNPLVLALAAPIAAYRLKHGAVDNAVDNAVGEAVGNAVAGAVGGAVDSAVRGAVAGAVGEAVGEAVGNAVAGAVGGTVRGAVDNAVGRAVFDEMHGAVRDAVDNAVGSEVRGAVGGTVRGAVDNAVTSAVFDAVDDAVRDAVRDAVGRTVGRAVRDTWWRRLGGQWWLSWQAYTSYFREVCGLELNGDTWERDRAYAQAQSAGWWWPHQQFVMVCERPSEIHLERIGPDGWNSHRLHCADGPAISWADGWGLYYYHGVYIANPRIITAPETLTAQDWLAEENAEVRRVIAERIGYERLLSESSAQSVAADEYGRLWRIPDPGDDEDIVLLDVLNSSPEPDGSVRRFFLRVPPDQTKPQDAVGWTFDLPNGSYTPQAMT